MIIMCKTLHPRDELDRLCDKKEEDFQVDVDYADDIVLLANITALAESLLYSLDRAASGIGLHVNAIKTEYMCFNQRGNISTLKCGPLKLVDKFTYLTSSFINRE